MDYNISDWRIRTQAITCPLHKVQCQNLKNFSSILHLNATFECMHAMTIGSLQKLQHSVAEYVQKLCACIEAAKDAHTVVDLLQHAKELLHIPGPPLDTSIPAKQHRTAASSLAPGGADKSEAILPPSSPASCAADPSISAPSLADHATAVQRCTASFEEPGAALRYTLSGTPFSELAGCLLSGDWIYTLVPPPIHSRHPGLTLEPSISGESSLYLHPDSILIARLSSLPHLATPLPQGCLASDRLYSTHTDDPMIKSESDAKVHIDDPVGMIPAVVAPDWLPHMSQTQIESLFDAWFLHVPASTALLALTTCEPIPYPGKARAFP